MKRSEMFDESLRLWKRLAQYRLHHDVSLRSISKQSCGNARALEAYGMGRYGSMSEKNITRLAAWLAARGY